MLHLGLLLLAAAFGAADPDDDDGDGFGEAAGDCDDSDSGVYPGAAEVCDGKDNDCDTVLDEGTECSDDDLDGASEDDGDCDDADALISPSAAEDYDGVDNDCDGVVDEGTVAYDDDLDGYSELEGDCSDEDPTFNPGELDVCRDGIDQDCSGLADDDCVESDTDGCDPDLAVTLSLSRFTTPAGGTVEVTAAPFTVDRALSPSLEWTVSGGTLSGEGVTRSWTLPGASGAYEVLVTVADPCGYGTAATGTVEVVAEPAEGADEGGGTEDGCAGKAAGLGLLLGLGGLRRRSRLAV